MTKSIVVVGGGGHAKVLISTLKKVGRYKLLGYTDRINRGPLLGIPYLGGDYVLGSVLAREGRCAAAIGVGCVSITTHRREIHGALANLGFDLPSVVSPHAIVNESVSIGAGTVVLDGAVVNSGTRIGECCILNTNCTVEHDCELGDFVHIAPGATLSGGITVGDDSLIGVGANVIQSVCIGERCLIGAGATVTRDTSGPGVYIGTPAKAQS